MIVSDNGTELGSRANPGWQQKRGVAWHNIAPGRPMQNGLVESSGILAQAAHQASTSRWDGATSSKPERQVSKYLVWSARRWPANRSPVHSFLRYSLLGARDALASPYRLAGSVDARDFDGEGAGPRGAVTATSSLGLELSRLG